MPMFLGSLFKVPIIYILFFQSLTSPGTDSGTSEDETSDPVLLATQGFSGYVGFGV